MGVVRKWQFWVSLTGVVVVPLASIALKNALDNALAVETHEKQLAVQQAAIQSNILASQLADLRGLLNEIYVRFDEANLPLPEAYEEVMGQARSARLNLIDGNLDAAREQITSAYEKAYSIPIPVGPPLIHEAPIDIETNF